MANLAIQHSFAMIKTFISLFLICLTIICRGQDISGSWNGVLNISETKLRIVFNITQTDNGYQATLDSPDQGAKGIPVTSAVYDHPSLKLEIKSAGIVFSGNFENDSIIGNFTQSGYNFPLALSKHEIKKEVRNRIQDPIEPFPYKSEEVSFKNITDNITLSGSLTIPETPGPHPAVVLISGSGPQNRNSEILGHKPFLIIADHLTRQGIAVLRFDDRGVGDSEGIFAQATSADFANDVMAAVNFLKSRAEINIQKIGLVGHSEGGLIAPIVAVNHPESLNFIVLLAGPGISGDKILLLQQELIGKAAGMSKDEIKSIKAINSEAFKIIRSKKNEEEIHEGLSLYALKLYKKLPQEMKNSEMSEDEFVKGQVGQLTNPWMLYFLRHEPQAYLRKVQCSVLAINGEKDLQVPADINLKAIKQALEKGGNKKVTTKKLPKLNHMFQHCNTGSPNEYAGIEQTFAPEALNEISDWIIKKVSE
jgi:uncharacterized protein